MIINNFYIAIGVLPNSEQHSIMEGKEIAMQHGQHTKTVPVVLDLRYTTKYVNKFFNALLKRDDEPNELIEESKKSFKELEKYINDKIFLNKLLPEQQRTVYEDIDARFELIKNNLKFKNIIEFLDYKLTVHNTSDFEISTHKTKTKGSATAVAKCLKYFVNNNEKYKALFKSKRIVQKYITTLCEYLETEQNIIVHAPSVKSLYYSTDVQAETNSFKKVIIYIFKNHF